VGSKLVSDVLDRQVIVGRNVVHEGFGIVDIEVAELDSVEVKPPN
jgi:hypothetical protein